MNSQAIIGLVIYTGPETRIQQNSAPPPRKLGKDVIAPLPLHRKNFLATSYAVMDSPLVQVKGPVQRLAFESPAMHRSFMIHYTCPTLDKGR